MIQNVIRLKCRRYAIGLTLGVLGLIMCPRTLAASIANLETDYVAGTTTGDLGTFGGTLDGTWELLGSDTVNPADDPSLNPLPWLPTWFVGLEGYVESPSVFGPAVFEPDVEVDGIGAHPGAQSVVVLRWIAGAPYVNGVTLSGNVSDFDVAGGDGIEFSLFMDGLAINAPILVNTLPGVDFSFTTGALAPNSVIDLTIDPRANHLNDSTLIVLDIDDNIAIPTPTTLTCFNLFLLLMMRRRGRK